MNESQVGMEAASDTLVAASARAEDEDARIPVSRNTVFFATRLENKPSNTFVIPSLVDARLPKITRTRHLQEPTV
jgi:hypothetical protein